MSSPSPMIANRHSGLRSLRLAAAAALFAAFATAVPAQSGGFGLGGDSGPGFGRFSQEKHTPKVQGFLLTDRDPVAPGETFHLGVWYEIENDWHIYWRNPGTAGIPTTIDLNLPEGFELGEINWPAPSRYEAPGDIVSYGYEKGVLLWMEAKLPANAAVGSTIALTGASDWLECDPEHCVPGSAELALTLNVAEKSAPSERDPIFQGAMKKTPRPVAANGDVKARIVKTSSGKVLELTGGPSENAPQPVLEKGHLQLSFFPNDEDLSGEPLLGKPAVKIGQDGSYRVAVPFERAPRTGEVIAGVLVVPNGGEGEPGLDAFALELDPNDVQPDPNPNPDPEPKPIALGEFAWYLWLSFLGGLILNIMPCVLPVISLKVVGMVRQGGESPAKVRSLGFAFAGGVWASFMVMALPLMGLKLLGKDVAWGEIFQYPDVSLALLLLLLVMGMSLLGVFEFQVPGIAQGAAKSASKTEGHMGSFLNGCLAVVLATPCMAPFLAGAMGYALLTAPVPTIPLFFTAVAAGLALPYVLLAIKPAWMKFLPKPGEWMITMKLLMGLLMISAAIFPFHILNDLAHKVGEKSETIPNFATWLLLFCASTSIAIFVAGRFVTYATPTGRKWGVRAFATALAVAGYWFFMANPMWSLRTQQLEPKIQWVKFSESKLEELKAEGKTVFVDFTASWCVSCQVNEGMFDTAKVRATLAREGIVAMKGDWTRRQDDIKKFLAKYGRAGVPFYIVFPGDNPDEPIILPEYLPESALLEGLEAALASKAAPAS